MYILFIPTCSIENEGPGGQRATRRPDWERRAPTLRAARSRPPTPTSRCRHLRPVEGRKVRHGGSQPKQRPKEKVFRAQERAAVTLDGWDLAYLHGTHLYRVEEDAHDAADCGLGDKGTRERDLEGLALSHTTRGRGAWEDGRRVRDRRMGWARVVCPARCRRFHRGARRAFPMFPVDTVKTLMQVAKARSCRRLLAAAEGAGAGGGLHGMVASASHLISSGGMPRMWRGVHPCPRAAARACRLRQRVRGLQGPARLRAPRRRRQAGRTALGGAGSYAAAAGVSVALATMVHDDHDADGLHQAAAAARLLP